MFLGSSVNLILLFEKNKYGYALRSPSLVAPATGMVKGAGWGGGRRRRGGGGGRAYLRQWRARRRAVG